jgi:16S rRNA (adenine1518-N6/adenine1519-N6)-dimethyltransferase
MTTAGALASLPPLRDVIARHGLRASKSLGQNFLLDLNLTRRIARAAGDLSQLNVVEIGPGPGGLTRALLVEGANRVVAVERDRRCIAALEEIAAAASDRLTIVEGDALAIDAADLVEPPRAVVANLPYNIATPLLLGWLAAIDRYAVLVLMLQREVADRILADPCSKAYGRLSVMAQWRSRPQAVLTLPPRAFTPAPKVESTVVRFAPRTDAPKAPWPAMERVVAAAFNQRRKMLRAALKPLGWAEVLLAEAGIDPTLRAEQLSVADFAALARAWAAR